MGFKRRSGTREATLALSEIIKQASKERPVLTAFVDVRAAYDSVIREVLYAKMLKMGIGGRFLTTFRDCTILWRQNWRLVVLRLER